MNHRHKIPDSVYASCLAFQKIIQEGKSASIVPQMQELTAQRAANLLGDSRQFFVRLLDDENFPAIGEGPTGGYIFRGMHTSNVSTEEQIVEYFWQEN